jgi:hypothetical protein
VQHQQRQRDSWSEGKQKDICHKSDLLENKKEIIKVMDAIFHVVDLEKCQSVSGTESEALTFDDPAASHLFHSLFFFSSPSLVVIRSSNSKVKGEMCKSNRRQRRGREHQI